MWRVRWAELKIATLTAPPTGGVPAYHIVPHLPAEEGGDWLGGLKIGSWYGRIFEMDEPGGHKGTIIHIHNVPPADVFTSDSK